MEPFGASRGAVCVPSMATSWTTQGPLVSSVRTVILPSGNAFSQVMAYPVASLALVALNPPGALNLMSSECSSCSAFSSWALNAATKRAVVSLDSVIASPPEECREAEGQKGYCHPSRPPARTATTPRFGPDQWPQYQEMFARP